MKKDRSLAQRLALLFGLAFLAVGILGFIPGVTTSYDQLAFAGKDSDAELLGLFQDSVLHNIVHLLFGVAGLAMARAHASARTYLLGAGVLYAALFVYDLFVDQNDSANFVPMNNADTWLHAVLSLALLAGYALTSRDRDAVRSIERAERPGARAA